MENLYELIDFGALATRTVEALPRVLAAILVFLVFYLLYRVLRRPLSGLMRKAGFHESLIKLLVNSLFRYTVLILGLVMAADQLGIDVGAALAGLGVAGIAVGFAARDSLSNIIAGVLIFWDKPFQVDDWITVEDEYGKVSEITLRSTRIRTPRNTFVVIPNQTMIDSVLENHSKHGELRVDVPVGIAYKEYTYEAREVLLAAVDAVEGLSKDPAPDVVVEELGGSSVNLLVRVWIEDASRERQTFADVVEAAKHALDDANIEIPFPHLQLFLDDVEQPVLDKVSGLLAAERTGAGEEAAMTH